jgi:hypothetical protein
MTGFVNPYGFVSLTPRDPDGLPDGLGDGPPAGHDRYASGRWSGSIPITLTTLTPLLLPDHARAATAGAGPQGAPPALPVRVDAKGRPMLSLAAVKGMLRGAYEAITNSRLGVFTGHDTPLAIRAGATRDVAEGLRPGVVIRRDEKARTATIRWTSALHPTEDVGRQDRREPQPAVWVPVEDLRAYRDRERLEAWIYLARHTRGFWVWRAAQVARPGELDATAARIRLPGSLTSLGYPAVRVTGLLHRTDSSFPAGGRKKHDERLFVDGVLDGPAKADCVESTVGRLVIEGWDAVIRSFATAHDTEQPREVKQKYGSYVHQPDQWRLTEGRTLHVEVNTDGDITALYPAMIGRKPFPGSPLVSLPQGHRPARSITQLSPADRVFGWARDGSDDARTAHRGHLRVCPGRDDDQPDESAIQGLSCPLALATLNSPKPAQFLFYLASANGSPLDRAPKTPGNGYPREPGNRRLRGRKVYLTHADVLLGRAGAEDYWEPPPVRPDRPATTVTVDGLPRYREYVAPPEFKPRVTTTVSEWVKPGVTFSLVLRVDNLSTVELQALLWLLNLPDDAPLKIGLGKPLGFGAVRVAMDWDSCRLFTGSALLDRYRSVAAEPTPTPQEEFRGFVEEYDHTLQSQLGQVREEFLAAARGYRGLPVHYPRAVAAGQQLPAGTPPPPAQESYNWWVSNDQVPTGPRHALPLLRDDAPPELRYLRVRERNKSSQPRQAGDRTPRRSGR